MPENASTIMRTSKDPKELTRIAVMLCRSHNPADHDELGRWLRSEDFLDRLDSEEKYAGPPSKLRIRAVLDELGQNQDTSAQQLLVTLTQARTFLDEPARVDLLIRACAVVRPAPPLVVRYWDFHCQPEDGYTHLTIEAIVENGSPPALALLERKMTDARHSDDDKTAWMLSSIMTHRNDLPLLQSCERLMTGKLPEKLRPSLIDALFDYKPTEWFTPATVLYPPDRKLASPEARAQLSKIGETVLKTFKVSARQKGAIEKTLKEVGDTK